MKTGAGQYFTPRPLIRAIVDVMRPGPDDTMCDPACGTGGFLLAAHDYILDRHPSMDRAQKERLQRDALLHGWEIVDSAARLCDIDLLSMVPRNWASAVSKARINVRSSVQHKCHSFTPPLHQMLTAVRDGRDLGPGGLSASMYLLMVALWIPNFLWVARSDIPFRRAF